MKLSAPQLTGLPLNWAVALALGKDLQQEMPVLAQYEDGTPFLACDSNDPLFPSWNPIENPMQAITIINEKKIGTYYDAWKEHWVAFVQTPNDFMYVEHDKSQFVAAMRTLVSKELGPSVNVPDDIAQA